MAQAARTFCRLCAPRSRIRLAEKSSRWPPSSRYISLLAGKVGACLARGRRPQPEGDQPPAQLAGPGQVPGPGVVAAEDGHVGGGLEIQDARLGRGVSLHAAVAVEVVGRDVENGRHLRRAGHQFELEAGQLEDDQVARLDLVQMVDERQADVPAHPGLARRLDARLGHAPNQAGGGGLAGRTGDAHHRAGDLVHEDLRVVGQRDAAALRFLQDGQAEGHPAGDADQVDAVQQLQRMAAHHPFDRQPGQRLVGGGQFFGGVLVVEGHHGALAG